ncbi:MAG: HEAT repeat domain-containing protein [Acidobacteriota bacterium]|nr:HEAT repeat domain-containing protein [Acidobacteriota bacterium]
MALSRVPECDIADPETLGKTLSGFGAAGVEPLLDLLQQGSEHSRIAAAAALARIADVRTREAMIASLEDPSPTVRRQAATALGRIGDIHALDALWDALARPEDPLRREHSAMQTAILAIEDRLAAESPAKRKIPATPEGEAP